MNSPNEVYKDRIMVVDDGQEDLALLERILSRRSFQVETFLDGEKALAHAKQNPPDLVFMDVSMPGMDGYEVCRLFQQDERLRTIPIIFLSALTSTEDKVKGFEVGGVDYISKPCQFDEVHARVNTHLRIHYLLKRQLKELENNYVHLRKLEALRDSLVHMIIHDMRSPLAVLTGVLSIIKKDIEKFAIPERTNRLLTDAIYSANNLTEMTSSTLDVSRMESGKLELHRTTFDFTQVVESVLKKIYIPESMPTLVRCFEAKKIDIFADQELVERILQNLLSNSFKFTPLADGLIKLYVEDSPESLYVKVEDNGPGVPEGEKENLFSKFWTGTSKKNGHRYSVGLGLTFCKMAVEAHQGEIGVEILSKEKKGICFWFKLPKHLTVSENKI